MASRRRRRRRKTGTISRMSFIFFAVIFIYLTACAVKYLTKDKVTIYEVYTGFITSNNTYTGIALRDETIYNSEYSGNINYFMREGDRAASGSIIYTVDETGRVDELLTSLNSEDNLMSQENLSIVKNAVSSFKINYSDTSFNDVYELKDKLETIVADSVNENIINNLDEFILETGSENLFRIVKSANTGIVVYTIDGYEDLTVSSVNKECFNKGNYAATNLKTEDLVVSGNPAYKVVNSEEWQIVIPLTTELIEKQGLADKDTVRIRFVKDDVTTNAGFSIVTNSDGTYGVLTLNKYMVRYATERYVDVEIIASTTCGLKIPNSAITQKEFFLIPQEYSTSGGNSSTIGFIHEYQSDDGKIVTEYTDATIYAVTDGYYYVDKEDFSYGDSIIMPDSSERYTISDIGVLQGVYSVNRGYATFRKIEILEQNSEYCIVKTGTSYGLSTYDHIILDSTQVEENQIIY